MKLSAFKFELPEELIAQQPADNRDESRLMVVDREKGTIEHKLFKDVIDYFDEGDVFVTNNTKVFSARNKPSSSSTYFIRTKFISIRAIQRNDSSNRNCHGE